MLIKVVLRGNVDSELVRQCFRCDRPSEDFQDSKISISGLRGLRATPARPPRGAGVGLPGPGSGVSDAPSSDRIWRAG